VGRTRRRTGRGHSAMATAVPPPASASPPGPARRGVPAHPRTARIAAAGLLAAVALIVLALALGGGGGAQYQLIFPDAGQLVRGDEVQVGGARVGSVTDIQLTRDYRARVTIHVNSSLTPLHEGTSAEIRVPSLASVANRYVALTPGPNNRPALRSGATMQGGAIHGVVDLDQLFNTLNPRTRKGLAELFQGSAEQYSGAGRALQVDVGYFPPSLSATSQVFTELSRDQPTFTSFLVETAKALTTIAARRQQLTELVSNANTTFAAIGSQQSNLRRGLQALPVALQQGNRTFQTLPPTLADLRKLVDVSKTDTRQLAPFFASLRSLLNAATPVVGEFGEAIEKPGANNDLTETALALPALASSLKTASPHGIRALEESLPVTALFGPYTPDLEGLIRDFGQADAYYDAAGHYSRVSGLFPDFALGENNTLKPVNPQQALAGLKTGQLRRCPGAATQPAEDGSSPFTDNGVLGCDPTQTP
jgi:phospholipid/cholesterol/gamma-HCH transport system substrate-binding protein